jgi:hypothetical protein
LLKYTLNILFCISSLTAQGRVEYSLLADTLVGVSFSQSAGQCYADSVYDHVKSMDHVIDFNDCNICKSRAHILSRVIEKNFPGLVTGKVWLFPDFKRISKREEYKYKPEVPLVNPGKCTGWIYHVAPVVMCGADTFVIDPATQKKAVKLGEWAEKLVPSDINAKGYLIIKRSEYFIYPDAENNYFEDTKPVWAEEDELLTDIDYSRSVDEMTRTKLGLVEPWRMLELSVKLRELVE